MGSAHVEDDEQRKIKRWQVELTPTGTCIAHYDRDGQKLGCHDGPDGRPGQNR